MSRVSDLVRQTEISATKTPGSCPNIMKLYSNGIGGVDIMDKSKYHFYVSFFFFDLIDIALVNSHIVYTKLGNDISLLNFKIGVAKPFIERYRNCK